MALLVNFLFASNCIRITQHFVISVTPATSKRPPRLARPAMR
jgi:hypothetical protein